MPQTETDHDVIVVGGGPAGCSTGVFTARYGLDTIVFDRGNAALRRCAYLENYLGFPVGIDVDAFHDLMHAHVDEAGCDLVPEMVVSVERTHDSSGFVVETQEGRQVTGEYVVAAAWYDGSYLRALGDQAMFEEREHHGDVEEHFDPDYADEDGRTPIDGLYVASPAGGRSAQAIVAAGNGAHVARSLIEDDRRGEGYTGGVTPHYDWARPESEYSGEWSDRDRWREYFENEVEDTADEQFVELRERYIDEAFETLRTPEEVESQSKRGVRRLVDVVGTETVLDAIEDETIREYIAETTDRAQESNS
jgi:hypothetical protein